MNKAHYWILVAATILVGAGPATAASPADKCGAAKHKLAGQYAFCRQKVAAKALTNGDAQDYSKCDAKYAEKWMSAETKSAGTCPTEGDAAAMKAFIIQHTDDVAAELGGGGFPMGCRSPATGQTMAYGIGSDGAVQAGLTLSYTDNGDGTITDNNTGLMWEKKDDSGGIHDKDNTYTWCGGSCGLTFGMDGTITTTFLATLNGGFAGYTDWRIPNVKELQGIINYERVLHSVDSTFDQSATCTGCTDVSSTTCSCTAPSNYWSSTTYGDGLCRGCGLFAWFVSFADGSVNADGKPAAFHVRAVRGGV